LQLGLPQKWSHFYLGITGNSEANDPHDIHKRAADFDGDTKEGIAGEIDTLRTALLVVIEDYAANVVSTPILYDYRYPYSITETDGRYTTFTLRLLNAAYNYQYSLKDPGGFAHNGRYSIQVLYDSLEDLRVDVTGLVRS